ncbi:TAR DNA-binding protein 43-like [Bacillus rossius redtenbacheri]|uniref:TAR DNA-binding protein 43-like n=1 Tax=Bacillus rossius redtenbacheri TaxID=93214 RepID=UPI002FDD62AF
MKESGNTSLEADASAYSCSDSLSEVKSHSSQEQVLVAEDEGDEPMELPTENDNTLLLSTLAAQYPGTSGLRYRNPQTNAMRGIRLTNGKLYPPENGWGDSVFYCVFPKENKRKSSDDMDNSSAKTKRIEIHLACSDLIVLGLPYKISEKQLREYFETFGEVVRAKIKRHSPSGQSRGFGIIRFRNYESQDKVVSQIHTFDGCSCYVKVYNVKEGDLLHKESRKVFVGGITENLEGDDLRDYFSAFGPVTNVFIPKTFRGFAFVTFLDPEVAQSLLGETHVIKGVTVQVSSVARKFDGNRRQGKGEVGGRQGSMQGSAMRNMLNAGPATQMMGGNMPFGMGTVPLNAALIAAALSQVGWNLASGLQGNLGFTVGSGGGGGGSSSSGGSGIASQSTAPSQGGPQREDSGHSNEVQKSETGEIQTLGWSANHTSGSECENVESQQ